MVLDFAHRNILSEEVLNREEGLPSLCRCIEREIRSDLLFVNIRVYKFF